MGEQLTEERPQAKMEELVDRIGLLMPAALLGNILEGRVLPNNDLVLDVEFMFDVTLSPTGDPNQDAPDVAFLSAALLLCWPLTILLSPQSLPLLDS
ncbi:uncharacterized protein ACA1_369790 [Acanthamoeba castellanii str. Neff]|uniref:Uncharacterized protein n=1 Tax=Acanthamoeba castellanii (strain ATCC 30010 / Neff) TaxID=1257118 RepID=L8H1H8_ACACF|nr:uncharacterized protein ACA1_369790 [Acanthamoeba castellanii str. Neff]ELR18236.1 hypothetical protein ACA1_369790 [Acanthamoeba castellanii str. Neff]